MIVSGHLRFTPSGRVRVSREAPTNVNCNTPTKANGVLCYTEEPPEPDAYNDEIGYANDGSVCVQLIAPTRSEDRGLRIATTEPIACYWNGLPFTADGRVAVFDPRLGGGQPGDDEEP